MRRLQLKVPPSIIHHKAVCDYTLYNEQWTSALLHGIKEPLASTDDLALFSDLIRKKDGTAFWKVSTAQVFIISMVIDSSQDCVALTRETLRALPSVSHIGHGISTYLRQRLFEAHQKVSGNPSASQSSFRLVELSELSALEKGKQLILFSFTNTITSMSLLDMPFASLSKTWFPKVQNRLEHLEHLDIQYRVFSEIELKWGMANTLSWQDVARKKTGEVQLRLYRCWRTSLRNLKQLKSLRMTFLCGCGRRTSSEGLTLNGPLYVDQILLEPTEYDLGCDIIAVENSEQLELSATVNKRNQRCIFPKLQSLAFVNCSLSLGGLLTIAAMHKTTIKELELRRVTFDPGHYIDGVADIANICKQHLPNLAYLRLARLLTYSKESTNPHWDHNGKVEALEYHEWRKGDKAESGRKALAWV